ncbi:MAG TPA: hypothetical protein VE954_01465 [Oligoflexus sp.]|uniref:hypothetical protein n=1 Tax=Oligoflexus sp. TaxID=1971216 RepID=UPI002D2FAA1A|nr:hypothetical protein [Oligoflexus sp.]HYX31751.1 hypothetical protein [Oligoflexus sp.]
MTGGKARFWPILLTAWIGACGGSDDRHPRFYDTIDRFPASDITEFDEREPVLDELEFRALIHRTIDSYQALAGLRQAKIALRLPLEADVAAECKGVLDEDSILRCSWTSDFRNADAGRSRQDPNWYLGFGGGLARLPAMTPEGFAMVICHEIGHLFGGFPFVREGFTGLALPVSVDGQADYFAAQVCVRKIWAQDNNALNKQGLAYRLMIDTRAVAACDSVYPSQRDRDLCYKTIFAGMSFAKALHKVNGGEPAPGVDTPDTNQVGVTDNRHPASQCRLDTFVAGALCPTVFKAARNPAAVFYDETQIPGYDMAAPGSEAARNQSMAASCHEKFSPQGTRPRCWFSPEQIEDGGWMNEL